MNFYVIRPSRSKNVIGHYPQVKDIKQNCHVWDEVKFVEHVDFQKIDFEPITANAVLYPSSKLTDLIDVVGMGFTHKPLISGKLKNLLQNNRESGMQFFSSDVLYNGQSIKDYWVLSMYEVNMEFVDFVKSLVYETKDVNEKSSLIQIKDVDKFFEVKKEIDTKGYPYEISISKIRIYDTVRSHFFALSNVEGGIKYIVSEKLKTEIEVAGCTGIEFQPVELSLAEWLHGGERERIYGKA